MRKYLFTAILMAFSSSIVILSWQPNFREQVVNTTQDDIRVIKNPDKPLYGELKFELAEDLVLGSETDKNYLFYNIWDIKIDSLDNIYVLDSGSSRIQKYDKSGSYLQTIGGPGQGPGEFEQPVHIFFDDQNYMYVLGMSKIHIFDDKGDFIKRLITQFFIMNIAPERPDNIFVTGHTLAENMRNLGVMILDSEGNVDQTLDEFAGRPLMRGGWTITLDYSPDLRISQLGKRGIVFGYSFEYTLYLANWAGEKTLIIKKDTPRKTLSRKEKNKILDDFIERTSGSGERFTKEQVEKAGNMPKYRPFFDRILTDDLDRIYVRRLKSVLDGSSEHIFDIFSPGGSFLYSVRLPFTPNVIKSGFMYRSSYSEETGATKVIRYLIKNWDLIKLN